MLGVKNFSVGIYDGAPSTALYSFLCLFSCQFQKIYRYAKFDQNIWTFGAVQVMSIFIKKRRPAKMMFGKALSPFYIPVAEQC